MAKRNRKRRAARWTYSLGRVTVRERGRRGRNVELVAPDPDAASGYRMKSLGFKVRHPETGEILPEAVKRAQRVAEQVHDQLRTTESPERLLLSDEIGLQALFAEYRRGDYRLPERVEELWVRVLGGDKKAAHVTPDDLDRFTRDRLSGAIDARGRPVPEKRRRPVGARSVENDVFYLRKVLRWATRARMRGGAFYLSADPLRGYRSVRETNPRRPVAVDDLYAQLLRVADQVHPFLPTLLVLAHETGRRITPICELRRVDLHLASTEHAPYGAILWPAETDKKGVAWKAPLTRAAREAIDRHLAAFPTIGEGYLFPAPRNPGSPMGKNLAQGWWRRAEKLAKVPHVKRRGWHSLRRKWATDRKHLADVDVMAAGGWRNLKSLKTSYQHADADGVLRAVLAGGD